MVSVILFGSAATGGFSEIASDVDLIFILRDNASAEDRRRLRNDFTSLEILHGFAEAHARRPATLESLFEKVTANHRSLLFCTRGDLLSANIAQIFDVTPAQAVFVDRIVVPGILSSSVTLWGENLVADVATPLIRRFDVWKAFYSLFNQVFVSAVFSPLLPKATRYAMGALKASVHSCFFCYHARRAALEEEVNFFLQRYGPSLALQQLLELRSFYSKSFVFVLRCLPALVRLHLRTSLDAKFQK
jgi:hypothetical protein